jgi:hypothetical protein
MKAATILAASLGALLLSGCGGSDSPSTMTPVPPTGGTPTGPTVVTTDFNVFTVQLALQQDAASERAPPVVVDDYTFAFNDNDGGTLATALPPP